MQVLLQKAILDWQNNTDSLISDMRQELADRRMVMAESILAHAQIGWAAEQPFVQETMGMAKAIDDYNIAAPVDTVVEEAWAGVDTSFDTTMRRLGLAGANTCEDIRVSRGMALVKTDLWAHQMRQAEARTIMRNDRRFSRQASVLALGRNILQGATSMGQLGAGKEIIRGALLGTINSAFQLAGYAVNRSFDPFQERWSSRQSDPAKVSRAPVFRAPVSDAQPSLNVTLGTVQNYDAEGTPLGATSAVTDYSVSGTPI